MKTGQGYMGEFTVVNATDEEGEDRRRIVVAISVPARSPISMAVAALSKQPSRITMALALEATNAIESIPCTISPPWGASNRGGFAFKAVMDYSDDLVRGLMSITQGIGLTIGLEAVQTEMETDVETQQVMEFVRGGANESQ